MNSVSQALLLERFVYVDGQLLCRHTTPWFRAGTAAGTAVKGYVCIRINGVHFSAHRIIWCMFNGEWPENIDHVNGDKSDNRIENLRACTRSQNSCNIGLTCRNTSGVKGVHWSSRDKKWEAKITIEGQLHYLGRYDSLAEAEEAVTEARNELHYHFARHK